ncbi:site-specific DNA methylase [Bradyrhizobium sp. YR681]|uniref:DNA cytosine methyltransferase n=1 Tax=Bradyrhizobium sp. YR681 TaxID=1144344 RepID=UPI00027105C8|nr:DNA cytosine methyltransferase [Bradyrhizobium sp. YR681]EJN11795.1 site-specific DNA methylase [Bradyrhizobium sp. YR681]
MIRTGLDLTGFELLDEITIDSFAGGGGTSEGHEAALGFSPTIAVNHDKFALAMHRINHPKTEHYVEDVVTIDAISMCDGRPVGMLWMSPDCKDHSKAKGGKPRDKNIRGLAWACFGWVKALPVWQRPRIVFLENVEEFQDWSPLLEGGKRCPIQKGVIFKQFVASWEALGYVVEWRERRAWRAGRKMQAATIRKRLYMIMRRDGEPIVWPEPTRGNPNEAEDAAKIAAGLLTPWKTAADCIDWSLPCPSIFDTAKEIKAKYGIRAIRPLVENTMARVAKGTHRYVLEAARPFIVPITHSGPPRTHSADEPLRTITTAKRGELAIVSPVLAGCGGRAAQTEAKGAGEPIITQTGKPDLCIVAPMMVPRYMEKPGHDPRTRPANEPLATIVAGGNEGRVAAVHLATMRNSQKPFNEAEKPAHTLTAGGANLSVVAAFMAQHNIDGRTGHGNAGHPVDEPVSTITAAGSQQSLAAVHMVNMHGTDRRGAPADVPLHTTTSGGLHHAAIMGFLAKYYGTGTPSQSADDPLHTVTAKPRFGLVEATAALPPFGPEHWDKARKVADFLRAHGYWDDREFVTVEIEGITFVIVDIGMRMLTARERFTAQGFRSDYIIDRGVLEDGTEIKFTAEQQGYMCGNSVCPPEAEDLIGANYIPRKVRRPIRPMAPMPLFMEAAE